jgi:hypothetical protein
MEMVNAVRSIRVPLSVMRDSRKATINFIHNRNGAGYGDCQHQATPPPPPLVNQSINQSMFNRPMHLVVVGIDVLWH